MYKRLFLFYCYIYYIGYHFVILPVVLPPAKIPQKEQLFSCKCLVINAEVVVVVRKQWSYNKSSFKTDSKGHWAVPGIVIVSWDPQGKSWLWAGSSRRGRSICPRSFVRLYFFQICRFWSRGSLWCCWYLHLHTESIVEGISHAQQPQYQWMEQRVCLQKQHQAEQLVSTLLI